MMFRKLVGAAVMAAGVMLLQGCESDPMIIGEGAAPAVRVDDPQAPFANPMMNTVVILDPALQRINGPGKITVESSGAKRTPSGTLEVWALIRNRTNHPLQIEGRTNFFDASRAPVDLATAWKRLYLPPLGIETYRAQSTLVYEIQYYMVELREGR